MNLSAAFNCIPRYFVGNKVKGRISKRVFQENKAREIFCKNEHFLPPDTHTYVCVCVSGDKKCSFLWKIWRALFLKTPVLRFALLPYYRRLILRKTARAGLLNRKSDLLKRRRENAWIDNTHSVFPVNFSGVSYGLITGIIVFKISINDIIEWINDLKLVNIKDGHSGKKY